MNFNFDKSWRLRRCTRRETNGERRIHRIRFIEDEKEIFGRSRSG